MSKETTYSNCCGAEDKIYSGADCSYSDTGYCPDCKEHCVFVSEEELKEAA